MHAIQQPIDPDPDDGNLVNHVPDELCVVVRGGSDADPVALYEEVRAALNQHLRQRIADAGRARLAQAGLVDSLALDLEPTELVAEPASNADLLRALSRRGINVRGGASGRQPWVALSNAGRRETTWHFYYQVGDSRVSFDANALPERRRRLTRIRELSNVLNLPAVGLSTELGGQDGRWSVSAGTPNWLTAATPFSCGSPAALPRGEERTGRWRVHFGRAATRALEERAAKREADVVVAILDTCPQPDQLSDRGNPHLAALLKQLKIVPGLPSDYFAPPADVPNYWNSCLPWWHESMPDTPADGEFVIPDHGVFVAGLVHDVAPNVEMHLIQVLNERGVGDLFGLEQVLRALPQSLLGNGRSGRKLIVNLSLGTAIPVPRARQWARWLPETRRSARGRWPDDVSNSMLSAAHSGLWNTIRWLHDQGVLVVAAAGNDALRAHLGGVLPPPRYPAYYQSVLAVAAAGPDGRPAVYSNRADVAPLGNGVTTFGGNVVVSRRSDETPEADPAATPGGRQQSVVGLYSSATLPRGEPNTTGWVHWAGTSFATAIVSGLAARLWQQDASLTPNDLVHRVRGLSRNLPTRVRRRPGRDPDGPLDAPYLEAWQEYEA